MKTLKTDAEVLCARYKESLEALNENALEVFLKISKVALLEVANILANSERLRKKDLTNMQDILSNVMVTLKKFVVNQALLDAYYEKKIKPLQNEIDHKIAMRLAKKINTSHRDKKPARVFNAGPMYHSDRNYSYELKLSRGVTKSDIKSQDGLRRESNIIRKKPRPTIS